MTKKSKPLPSAELLRSKFDYDPDTGVLTWGPETRLFGKVAGCLDKGRRGYRCISVMVDYRSMKAHRVIWKIVTGQEPPDEIDHIDGDATNNRWRNLRDGTDGVNNKNIATSSRNRVGVRGVYPANKEGSWCAAIYVKRKRIYLGTFKTVKEAEEATLTARKGLGFGPNHGARLAS